MTFRSYTRPIATASVDIKSGTRSARVQACSSNDSRSTASRSSPTPTRTQSGSLTANPSNEDRSGIVFRPCLAPTTHSPSNALINASRYPRCELLINVATKADRGIRFPSSARGAMQTRRASLTACVGVSAPIVPTAKKTTRRQVWTSHGRTQTTNALTISIRPVPTKVGAFGVMRFDAIASLPSIRATTVIAEHFYISAPVSKAIAIAARNAYARGLAGLPCPQHLATRDLLDLIADAHHDGITAKQRLTVRLRSGDPACSECGATYLDNDRCPYHPSAPLDRHVTAEVSGPGAHVWADWDQSIGGSSWETPSDMPDFAYAMPGDHPGLVAELEAEGYVLDLSEYETADDDAPASVDVAWEDSNA